MKNILSKLKPAHIAIFVLLLLGVTGSAQAGSIFSWLRVEDKVADRLADKQLVAIDSDPVLGAVVSADSLPAMVCTNDYCSYTAQVRSFNARSTTIFGVPSPFLKATSTGAGSEVVIFTDDGGKKYTSATATVDLVRFDITSAPTTSYHIACAASANFVGTLPFHNPIVTTSPSVASYIATSSIGMIENNLSLAQGGLAGSGSVAKVTVNSALPYIVCTLNPSEAIAITNADETLDGNARVRFNRPRF